MGDVIDCQQKCKIPESITVKEVPRPRHPWGDVFVCPNDGCGKAFVGERKDSK